MLVPENEAVRFVFDTPGEEPREISIEPRKTKNESNPVIGIGWPMILKLPEKRDLPAGGARPFPAAPPP